MMAAGLCLRQETTGWSQSQLHKRAVASSPMVEQSEHEVSGNPDATFLPWRVITGVRCTLCLQRFPHGWRLT